VRAYFALQDSALARPKISANMSKVEDADFSIKPENVTPNIPTSEWPLLLKNYDKCTSLRFKCMRLELTQTLQYWCGPAISRRSQSVVHH
jgi:hypothetical protein